MNKKILAFAGSTSSTSINKQLVEYTCTLLKSVDVEIIDINDFTADLFSVDEEKNGFPSKIINLNKKFSDCDGFVISLAEHNGSYAAAYKNMIDWLSRIDRQVFKNKPVLLMSAAPGGRGGASVLEAAKSYYPRLGANIVSTFSLPNFYDNFSKQKLTNLELYKTLEESAKLFNSKL